MTFNCQAESKSADFMLLASVQRSKSEDVKLRVIKNELGIIFFLLKNAPILIRRVGN